MKLSQGILSLMAIAKPLSSSASSRRRLSKTSKSPKATKDSLIATVHGVGVANDALVGTTTLRYNPDGSFLVSLDILGLKSNSGTVVITDGTSCGTISETPFTKKDSFDGVVNAYAALDEGVSRSAFRFNSGYTSKYNMGKSMIVYDSSSAIVGCGILGSDVESKVLKADMGTYPGYTGTYKPSGTVTVTFNDDDTFTFQFKVKGIEANCSGCGIHIHAGTSCATHELVKGHGWNSVYVQDLWTAAGGATYSTDSKGIADGFFNIYNGYGYEENKHHAVVIHMADGSRVGCGVLM
eukprot:scaffold44783_cov61-Cyclotella_meneghiniana.AAC.2